MKGSAAIFFALVLQGFRNIHWRGNGSVIRAIPWAHTDQVWVQFIRWGEDDDDSRWEAMDMETACLFEGTALEMVQFIASDKVKETL